MRRREYCPCSLCGSVHATEARSRIYTDMFTSSQSLQFMFIACIRMKTYYIFTLIHLVCLFLFVIPADLLGRNPVSFAVGICHRRSLLHLLSLACSRNYTWGFTRKSLRGLCWWARDSCIAKYRINLCAIACLISLKGGFNHLTTICWSIVFVYLYIIIGYCRSPPNFTCSDNGLLLSDNKKQCRFK